MTTNLHDDPVDGIALDLVSAATGAHVALSLGWPHYARDLAATVGGIALRLSEMVEDRCTAESWAREADERRTGSGDVLDELRRRHAERVRGRECQGGDEQ